MLVFRTLKQNISYIYVQCTYVYNYHDDDDTIGELGKSLCGTEMVNYNLLVNQYSF